MVQFDKIYAQVNGDVEIKGGVSIEGSEVQKFYADKTLFITGATGFMGKCLLEKLLRSCPDLKHIYILMREKVGASLDKRLKRYFEHELFGPLKKINPNFEKKVTAMRGDLDSDNLGLSKADQDILKNEVNIIFHNGSNVKFSDRVHIVLTTNVLGTKNLLDLAEECQNLNIFVYVSTAYSHSYRKIIMEEFYESYRDLSTVLEMIRIDNSTENGMSEETLKKWIGNHFNAYTFSKAICEELVRQRSERSTFACGVFRPSIVNNIIKEPLPGWIGNMNGTVIPLLTYCLGILHAHFYNNEIIDLVPCDMTISALIVTTRDLFKRWANEKKPLVYNYGSSTIHPFSISDIQHTFRRNLTPRGRSSKAVWLDFIIFSENILVFSVCHIFFHFIPACIADMVLLIIGKKPKLLAIFFKITRVIDKIAYLTNSDWRIHVPETLKAIDSLNSIDKELFFCDIRELPFEEGVCIGFLGYRKYLLKESLESNAGTIKYWFLWLAHYSLITILFLTFCFVLMKWVF